MDSISIFTTALEYEKKIRDLYVEAADKIDDERGKGIFNGLAEDEQSHVDFLNYSLQQLRANNAIDVNRLQTAIPARKLIDKNIEKMKAEIPERMLGDIKTVLNSALKLEKETSAFYKDSRDKSEGAIREILNKFFEIEERHVDVVQIEIDHAMKNGMWFNFMEMDLEAE
jgi:rubrerythrin